MGRISFVAAGQTLVLSTLGCNSPVGLGEDLSTSNTAVVTSTIVDSEDKPQPISVTDVYILDTLDTLDADLVPPAREFEIVTEAQGSHTQLETRFAGEYLIVSSAETSSIYQVSIVTGEVKLILDAKDGLVEPHGLTVTKQGLWWTDIATGTLWYAMNYVGDNFVYQVVLDGLDEPTEITAFDDTLFIANTGADEILQMPAWEPLYNPDYAPNPEVVFAWLNHPRRVAVSNDGSRLLWTEDESPHLWGTVLGSGDSTREIAVENAASNRFALANDWLLVFSAGEDTLSVRNVNVQNSWEQFYQHVLLAAPSSPAPSVSPFTFVTSHSKEFNDHLAIWASPESGTIYGVGHQDEEPFLLTQSVPAPSGIAHSWHASGFCFTVDGFWPIGIRPSLSTAPRCTLEGPRPRE